VMHDERWYLIQPRKNALVVNIGDIVQVWSNDQYRAPLHRVLANASMPRYSAPFFYNPSYATVYAPLPSVCDGAHPPRYRPICWGEFRAARAAGDYADYGEEVQISHYGLLFTGRAIDMAGSTRNTGAGRTFGRCHRARREEWTWKLPDQPFCGW
jgi:2OG-Fe(II) oxygenase superfamily